MGNQILLFLFFLSQFLSIIAQSDDTYIVQMDLALMPKAFSTHHDWFSNVLASVGTSTRSENIDATSTKNPLPPRLVYSYSNVFHGFSATLSPSELQELQNSSGFVSIMKDRVLKVDTTHSSKFIGLNPKSGSWPKSNFGKDVIIGLVDSGIWPESKSFDDVGMTDIPSKWKGECQSGTEFNSTTCNKKLIGARYFNKGYLAKNKGKKIDMNSARDTDGHGTHTSSTAAGNFIANATFFGYAPGTSSGMAPQARVAMYKIIWGDEVYASDAVAAIDQAIIDGVDVLSLSFGIDTGLALYEDPVAVATFAAMEKGIFVSASAGNSGFFFRQVHNGSPWVLTVAAGTVDREFVGSISLGNGISVSGVTLYPGNSTSKMPIVKVKCDDEKEVKKYAKKIVVCEDGNSSVYKNYFVLHDFSKVAGGVFITNETELWHDLESDFPAVYFNLEQGQKILDYIKNNAQATASLGFHEMRLGTKPAPTVASYSSRGPAYIYPFLLKPDLMAPGDFILASWPSKTPVIKLKSGENLFNDFNIISGTSMACPHAAGVAALLRGMYPEWSPAAIRSAMMTTTDTLDNTQQPIKDFAAFNNIRSTQVKVGQVATPLAMGAGHINPNKAMDPGLVYDLESTDYANQLCALNFTAKQIRTITRSSSYNCSNPSFDINYPSFITYFNRNETAARVQKFRRTVTNVGDEMSTYTAKFTAMDGFQVKVVPATLTFRHKNEKQSYTLSVEGPKVMTDDVVFSYLSWIGNGGKYVVRSPIVAADQKLTVMD